MKRIITLLLIIVFLLSGCKADVDEPANPYIESDGFDSVEQSDRVIVDKPLEKPDFPQSDTTPVKTPAPNENKPTPEPPVKTEPEKDGEYVIEGATITEYVPLSHVSSDFIAAKNNNTVDVDTDVKNLLFYTVRTAMSFEIGCDISIRDIHANELINFFEYDYDYADDGEPFAVFAETFECPWNSENELIRLAFTTKKQDRTNSPPSNFVFVVSTFEEMKNWDKLPMFKRALYSMLDIVKEGDRISIIAYDTKANVLVDGVSDTDAIRDAIDSLSIKGGVNTKTALNVAFETAQKHFIEGGNNRVFLATNKNGKYGFANAEEFESLVISNKEKGIDLSVFDFDWLSDRETINDMIDRQIMDCYFLDDYHEIKQVIMSEFCEGPLTVAENVTAKAIFNPDTVSKYRIVGYENHRVSEGVAHKVTEIGADFVCKEQFTVLFEVEPTDKKGNYMTFSLRYRTPEDTSNVHSKEYVIDANSYTETPDGDSVFAAAVAQVCMKMIDTEYTKDSSYLDIYNRIKDLESVKNDFYKSIFADYIKTKK